MTEFNKRTIEDKLGQLGRELQNFFENIIPDEGIDTFNPRADVVQTSEGFEISLDLPGLSKNEIKVELKDSLLTVRGQREIVESADHVEWLRRERPYGRFLRSFPMTLPVDRSSIKASFKNGVLLITIKAEAAEDSTTSIPIN